MKGFLFISLFHLGFGCSPLIVGVFMIKNEAPVIVETLESYVKSGITDYVLFDTGSKDDTIEISKKYFDDQKLNGIIETGMFVDFATSRNEGLRRAEKNFPDACFMLMPDAEWILNNGSDLVSFCESKKSDTDTSYSLKISSGISWYLHRLFRVGSECRFVGVVHEVILGGSFIRVPSTFFTLMGTSYNQQKSSERWHRDKDLLHKELENNPNDPRTTFYLAQTYKSLQDWHNAAVWYLARTELDGWNEENFFAFYELGNMYNFLGEWDKALVSYTNAIDLRPGRVEPYVKLSEHYWNQQSYDLAYMYAKRSSELPMTTDVLFVNTNYYNYYRYDLLGRAAWYVGNFDIGEKAVLTAIKVNPEATHLIYNLELYQGREGASP